MEEANKMEDRKRNVCSKKLHLWQKQNPLSFCLPRRANPFPCFCPLASMPGGGGGFFLLPKDRRTKRLPRRPTVASFILQGRQASSRDWKAEGSCRRASHPCLVQSCTSQSYFWGLRINCRVAVVRQLKGGDKEGGEDIFHL